jgi:hypothetical protein
VVRLRRNGKTLSKKEFAIPGGQTRSVTVKLTKAARKLLKRHTSLRIRLSVTGTDGAHASIAASQRVTSRP